MKTPAGSRNFLPRSCQETGNFFQISWPRIARDPTWIPRELPQFLARITQFLGAVSCVIPGGILPRNWKFLSNFLTKNPAGSRMNPAGTAAISCQDYAVSWSSFLRDPGVILQQFPRDSWSRNRQDLANIPCSFLRDPRRDIAAVPAGFTRDPTGFLVKKSERNFQFLAWFQAGNCDSSCGIPRNSWLRKSPISWPRSWQYITLSRAVYR